MCRQAVAKICRDVGHVVYHVRLLMRIIADVKELSPAFSRENQSPERIECPPLVAMGMAWGNESVAAPVSMVHWSTPSSQFPRTLHTDYSVQAPEGPKHLGY